jgi:hypothetical protein
MKRVVLLLCILVGVFLHSGCGEDRQFEYYGDITTGPGGISLIDPNEHPGGFGRWQCLTCHNATRIHRNPGSAIANPDLLNQLVKSNGLAAYCLICHGPNGL